MIVLKQPTLKMIVSRFLLIGTFKRINMKFTFSKNGTELSPPCCLECIVVMNKLYNFHLQSSVTNHLVFNAVKTSIPTSLETFIK